MNARKQSAAQRARAAEQENRELRAILENLAAAGQVAIRRVDDGEAFNAGFREGHAEALAMYRKASDAHFLAVELPLSEALRALDRALAGSATLAGFVATPRADFRELLRQPALRSADDLRARFQTLEELLAGAGERLPNGVTQEIIRFHEALRTFGLGRDNGEALAQCAMVRDSLAGELTEALAALRVGGRTPSDARAWIGQRVAEARQRTPPPTYRAAVAGVYRELLEKERAHELLAVEEQALRELDTRAKGMFRERGELTKGAVNFCKRTAEDWRQRGHE